MLKKMISEIFQSKRNAEKKENKKFTEDEIQVFFDAANFGRDAVINDFIKKGMDVNINIDGKVALVNAAWEGHLDVVRILHSHGANLDARCKLGRSALHYAAYQNKVDVVKYLLAQGVKPNPVDKQKITPLYLACMTNTIKESFETVEFLLSNGADINISRIGQESVLHAAACGGNCKVIDALLSRGMDINSKDMIEKTPLMFAVENENYDAVKILIERGSDVNASSHGGEHTALSLALDKLEEHCPYSDWQRIVDLLKSSGATK